MIYEKDVIVASIILVCAGCGRTKKMPVVTLLSAFYFKTV
jgi:hypothetical protein